MIPEFPKFKKLELSDREEIEKITNKFPPYSDFNFTSMWSWDIKGEMRLSKLNGNLIVRFNDYQTGEPFYSFIGANETADTARKLIELSIKEGLEPKLKLIPEESTIGLSEEFIVEEDRDHHDYIYETEKLISYSGNLFKSHRYDFKKFIKQYGHSTVDILNPSNQATYKNILKVVNEWLEKKPQNKRSKLADEITAIERFLKTYENHSPTLILGIFDKDKMISFSVCLLSNSVPITLFLKADTDYQGSFSHIMREKSKELIKNDYKYINFAQDLGIPGLRQSKKSFRPVRFLNKFFIKTK